MTNLIEDPPRPVATRRPGPGASMDPGRIVLVVTTVVALAGALCGSVDVRRRFLYPMMYDEAYHSTVSWHAGVVLTWPGWSIESHTLPAALPLLALTIAVGSTHIGSGRALRRRRVVTGGRVFASTWLVVFCAAAIAGMVQAGSGALIGAESLAGASIWAIGLTAAYAAGWGLLTGLLAAISALVCLRFSGSNVLAPCERPASEGR